MEKVENNDFSGTIEVYDLKVDICHLKIYALICFY